MATIAVVGSLNLDVILFVDRVPEDGENVYVQRVEKRCGGKGANAAIAVSRLGNETLFYGSVGRDEEGDILLQNLAACGVPDGHIQRKDAPTGTAYILIQRDGGNRIIVSPGANEALTAADIEAAGPLLQRADLVLMQLEINPEAIDALVAYCARHHKKLVVDAGPIRGIRAQQLAGVYCVSPNESELEALVGYPVADSDSVAQAAQLLLDQYGIEHVVVKLGGRGAYYAGRTEQYFMPAYSVPVVDTTAAGDSFMAGLCTCLAAGGTMRDALDCANRCGAIAVTRAGSSASVPSREDLDHFASFLKKD